jgi:cyclin-dependent kinase 7
LGIVAYWVAMDAPVRANLSTAQKYTKTSKIGEGTYAVVYSGMYQICPKWSQMRRVLSTFTGQEIATGRKVAIKKIKVGGFKDGLDMSAIREVKFLQELHHPNILEVSPVAAFDIDGPT